MKNFLQSQYIVNFILKSFYYSKNPAIKNNIFGPFRFVEARFHCSDKNDKSTSIIVTIVINPLNETNRHLDVELIGSKNGKNINHNTTVINICIECY